MKFAVTKHKQTLLFVAQHRYERIYWLLGEDYSLHSKPSSMSAAMVYFEDLKTRKGSYRVLRLHWFRSLVRVSSLSLRQCLNYRKWKERHTKQSFPRITRLSLNAKYHTC